MGPCRADPQRADISATNPQLDYFKFVLEQKSNTSFPLSTRPNERSETNFRQPLRSRCNIRSYHNRDAKNIGNYFSHSNYTFRTSKPYHVFAAIQFHLSIEPDARVTLHWSPKSRTISHNLEVKFPSHHNLPPTSNAATLIPRKNSPSLPRHSSPHRTPVHPK